MGAPPSQRSSVHLDAEFARALHSFQPTGGSNTCLSFEAGQVIRTLNKDGSGWWDGELEGKRGWFPSNYVEIIQVGSGEDRIHEDTKSPHDSRSSSKRSSEILSEGSSSLSSSSPSLPASSFDRRSSNGGVLESIQQAITLLQNAVLANRVAHFQPSTACVISSVRTVLSSTDCLTRESKVLSRHPALAAERKHILASLAALVNQARRASSPSVGSEEERAEDTEVMLSMAESVSESVNRFLAIAAKLGVRLAERDRVIDERTGTDVKEAEVGSGRPQELRIAKSRGELKSRRPNLRLAPTSIPSPSQSGNSRESTARKDAHLANGSSTPNLNLANPAPTHVTRTTLQLNAILTTIHDQLLSTIAAFIGHVHAHTRSSHSSSYAYLIDMTRDTIEKVREILVVVEGVSNHPTLGKAKEVEISVLATCKEAMYVATTALVTAARVATSAPTFGEDAFGAEDEEKNSLLHSATAVLRSGGACVEAVKVCIGKRGSSGDLFELVLLGLDGPSSSANTNRRSTTFDARLEEERDRSTSKIRGTGPNKSPHTLSMLGRKATSLSCLRDMYEAGSTEFASVAEEGENEGRAEEREGRLNRSTAPDEGEDLDEGQDESVITVKLRDFKVDDEEDRFSPESYNHDRLGSNRTPLPVQNGRSDRGLSPTSSSGSHSERTTTISARTSPTNSSNGYNGARPNPSRMSSDGRIGSVPMSRGESSMTSDSVNSSRSALSRTSTNETSPRSSSTSTREAEAKFSDLLPTPPLSHGARPTNAPPLPSPSNTFASSPTSLSFKEGNTWFLERDYAAREISFNGDGHVTGGTLRCLIERMTLHDTTIDLTFSKTFFLTFRMFTNPTELSQALFTRFDITPPTYKAMRPEELKLWNDSKATPVRLRIYNLFKTWVESHWNHETDSIILEPLLAFCRGRLASSMATASQRLIDLIQKRALAIPAVNAGAARPRPLPRRKSSDRLGRTISSTGEPYPSTFLYGANPPPPSITSKNLLATLRGASSSLSSITEIDPLELARQLTIMESRLYCRVKPGELLGMDMSKKNATVAVNVRAMSTLSTRLTGWCAETILNEQDAKKRTALLKYFVKLCDRCLVLNNYNTLMAILCALNSSTIARLKKTWDGLSAKYRVTLDMLRKATEHSRNYNEYRARIRNAVPPCLPFLGLFLTDITFCYEGNPAGRPSPVDPSLRLINFDRYQKMSRIVTDLQRFQEPYNLIEVGEIQAYLSNALDGLQHGGDVSSLYRQSLVLEPRTDATAYNPNSMTTRGGADLFNWKA